MRSVIVDGKVGGIPIRNGIEVKEKYELVNREVRISTPDGIVKVPVQVHTFTITVIPKLREVLESTPLYKDECGMVITKTFRKTLHVEDTDPEKAYLRAVRDTASEVQFMAFAYSDSERLLKERLASDGWRSSPLIGIATGTGQEHIVDAMASGKRMTQTAPYKRG